MATVQIEIQAVNQAESAMDQVIDDIEQLGTASRRQTANSIADAKRLSAARIREAERVQRAQYQADVEAARQQRRLGLRQLQDAKGLSAEQRRLGRRQFDDAYEAAVRYARSERDLNLQRLRNARETIDNISKRESALLTKRKRDAREFERVLDRVKRSYEGLERSAIRFASIGFLGVVGGVGVASRYFIDAAVQIDTARNSLIAFTGSAEEADRRLQRLRNLARLPGISFEGASRAAIQLEGVGLEAARAERLIRGVGNALALVGNTDLSPAIRAISQIISRGEVLQEEINQLVEATPIASRALTQEFGTTLAENIRSQLTSGADEFVTRITNALNNLPQADVGGAANVFQNFRIAVRDLGAEIGNLALPTLTREIRELTDIIRNQGLNAVARLEDIFNRIEPSLSRLSETVVAAVANFGRLYSTIRLFLIGAGIIPASRLIAGLGGDIQIASQAANQSFGIFGRLSGALSKLAGTLRVLGGVGAAAGIVISLWNGISLVRQIDEITRIAAATDNFAESMNKLVDGPLKEVNRRGILTSQAHSVAELGRVQERIKSVTDEIARLKAETPLDIEARDANLAQIKRLESVLEGLNGRLLELQRQQPAKNIEESTPVVRNFALELVNVQNRISELNDELSVISSSSTVAGISGLSSTIQALQNALRSQRDIQIAPIDADIAEQRKIIENVKSTAAERQKAQEQLNHLIAERRQIELQTERDITEIVRQEIQLRLRLQESADSEEVSLSQRAQQRIASIYADRGVQARQITRQNVNANLAEAEREVEEIRKIQVKRNIDEINASFERVQANRDTLNQQIKDYTDYANRILGYLQRIKDFNQRVDREIREQNDASRQTPQQRTVVDTLVGTDPASVTRDRLRSVYDAVKATGERIMQLQDARARSVASTVVEQLSAVLSIPAELVKQYRDRQRQLLEFDREIAEERKKIQADRLLSAEQQTRALIRLEQNSVRDRAALERSLNEQKSNYYRDFISTALGNLARLVQAELQAAIIRQSVSSIERAVTPALASLGTTGSLFALAGSFGLLEFASSLFAGSFHNPRNDALARQAGINRGIRFGEQSAADIVANYDSGFRKGLSQINSNTGNPTNNNRGNINVTVNYSGDADPVKIGEALRTAIDDDLIPALG